VSFGKDPVTGYFNIDTQYTDDKHLDRSVIFCKGTWWDRSNINTIFAPIHKDFYLGVAGLCIAPDGQGSFGKSYGCRMDDDGLHFNINPGYQHSDGGLYKTSNELLNLAAP
jgi:hypothetical protein